MTQEQVSVLKPGDLFVWTHPQWGTWLAEFKETSKSSIVYLMAWIISSPDNMDGVGGFSISEITHIFPQ